MDLQCKRRRRELQETTASRENRPPAKDATSPLQGVHLCLSGFYPEEKTRLHRQIEALGGSCSRDLVPGCTHLVAAQPSGVKYEAALQWKGIYVVSESWILACHRTKARVSEREHSFWNPAPNKASKGAVQLSVAIASLAEASKTPSLLFRDVSFHFLAFDDASDDYGALRRLVRTHLGTILWTMHEDTNYIVVQDDAKDTMRTKLCQFAAEHGAQVVSPWWIVESVKLTSLQPSSSFKPQFRTASIHNELSNGSKSPSSRQSLFGNDKSQSADGAETEVQVASNIFHGVLFGFMESSSPAGAVSFDALQLETAVCANGGLVLTQKMLDSLQQNKARPKCFIICWGDYRSSHLAVHPFFSRVKRLTTVVETTALWLETCLSEKRMVSLERCPILFMPQPWSILSCPEANLRVSITGFCGPKRTAVTHLIRSMGAVFDNSMRKSTTHLVCDQTSGDKYAKAQEWGITTVTLDWLLHVARYGVGGKKKDKGGCEHLFPVAIKN